MTKLPLLAIAGLLIAGLCPAAEEGFVSIFDGKTFDGWKISGKQEAFKVEDGAIVANGTPSHCFYMGKEGDAKFKDFELRLEVMTKPNSNGGVYFHTQWQEQGWPGKGYEVQVNNTQKDWRKSGGLYAVVDNKEPFEDDTWMQYVVRVEDGVINVTINGKQLVKDFKPEGKQDKLAKDGGTFALQAHDPGSTVLYKNIRVKALD
ncbi:glycosyl hydrolase [Haloferula helveola]|uniref:Glycosyl hydrolase n=1 Tax=Haloferula helveola TaxID=490095 RepID=A0ABM7RI35_9BACT|nr:glycosyl hydrolase [Haloferula helveola]